MAISIASGFTSATGSSGFDIIRNRTCANQESMQQNTRKPGRLPMYFVNTSSAFQPSNPNSMRDMGATRNVVYQLDDPETDNIARTVKWRELIQNDIELSDMAQKM